MVEVQLGVSGVRHPDDPDPVESTKVVAAYTLAAIGLLLAPFVGGAIPAFISLLLLRQAEDDIRASGGFLLGAGRLRRIRRLARIALLIAAAVVVAVLLVWLLDLARHAGQTVYEGEIAAELGSRSAA